MPRSTKLEKSELAKIQSVQVKVARANSIELSLPANILRAIRSKNNVVHVAVVNGVLQITGSEPALFLPITTLVKEDFRPANE